MIEQFTDDNWNGPFAHDSVARAAMLLEYGCVLYFPRLRFAIEEEERQFLARNICDGKSKNVSFNPAYGTLRGAGKEALDASSRDALRHMIRRFSDQARTLARGILPDYRQALELGMTSFRPAEVAGRKMSCRKDDSRMHVDAFPSRPTRGKRILRVFTNVGHRPRVWRLGESFEALAEGFAAALRMPLPGSGWLLRQLKIVKGLRSPYDHLMLQLHNRMKADECYQRHAVKEEFLFPPNSSWMVFTDQVPHAALAGQFALEQTLFVPVSALNRQTSAPIRVLEEKLGRSLV